MISQGVFAQRSPGQWAVEEEKVFIGVAAASLLGLAAGLAGLEPLQGLVLWLLAALLAARFAYMLAAEKRFTVDLLMAIVAGVSAFYRLYGEGLVVMLLYGLAEAVEERVEGIARRRIEAAARLLPRETLRLRGGSWERVQVEELRPGDVVLVPVGEAVPADGVALSRGVVDNSVVTGEPYPVEVGPGDPVYSGAVVLEGPLRVEVARPPGESFTQRLVALAEEALERKTRLARLVEKAAAPMTVVVLAAYAAAHLALGPERALSVLLAGCPSAYIITSSFQASYSVAILASRGALVRGGYVLEAVPRLRVVVLDKTGTLTRLRARLLEGDPRLEPLVAAAAGASRHPVSRALAALAPSGAARVEEAREVRGVGVEAVVEGRRVMIARGPPHPCGPTVEARVEGERLIYCIEEEPAPGAEELVSYLRSTGRRVVIASGDRVENVARLAERLGVEEYHGGMRPEDKARLVEELRARHGPAGFIGDGVNDAPALAAADLGIAVGGLDVAREAADAVVQSPLQALEVFRLGDVYPRSLAAAFTVASIVKAVVAAAGLAGAAPLALVALLGDDGSTLAAVAASALATGRAAAGRRRG